MTPTEMLHLLYGWRDAGWLRRLDVAFARFTDELDADAPASLLLAAALAAHLEGRGHSALPLAELAAGTDVLLGWPLEGGAALRQTWAENMADSEGGEPPPAWQSQRLLEIEPEDDAGASPLVLCRGLLYLRRYWRYESRVAVQINARVGQGTEPGEAAATATDKATD